MNTFHEPARDIPISRDVGVVVVGGGPAGLAAAIASARLGAETVLIEQDRKRAEECSEVLDNSLVISGNVSDRATLKETGIKANTAFVATTGDDELNILSCVLARQLGARWLAGIRRPGIVRSRLHCAWLRLGFQLFPAPPLSVYETHCGISRLERAQFIAGMSCPVT